MCRWYTSISPTPSCIIRTRGYHLKERKGKKKTQKHNQYYVHVHVHIYFHTYYSNYNPRLQILIKFAFTYLHLQLKLKLQLQLQLQLHILIYSLQKRQQQTIDGGDRGDYGGSEKYFYRYDASDGRTQILL